jgi:hypothetical protein
MQIWKQYGQQTASLMSSFPEKSDEAVLARQKLQKQQTRFFVEMRCRRRLFGMQMN